MLRYRPVATRALRTGVTDVRPLHAAIESGGRNASTTTETDRLFSGGQGPGLARQRGKFDFASPGQGLCAPATPPHSGSCKRTST